MSGQMKFAVAAAWLVLLFHPSARPAIQAGQAYQFVVIVNKESQLTQLSLSKLKIIFLRKISRWPWGAEIYPVDLPESSALRQEFGASQPLKGARLAFTSLIRRSWTLTTIPGTPSSIRGRSARTRT